MSLEATNKSETAWENTWSGIGSGALFPTEAKLTSFSQDRKISEESYKLPLRLRRLSVLECVGFSLALASFITGVALATSGIDKFPVRGDYGCTNPAGCYWGGYGFKPPERKESLTEIISGSTLMFVGLVCLCSTHYLWNYQARKLEDFLTEKKGLPAASAPDTHMEI